MTSADNQQERLHHIPNELGYYLSGFAEGEGSFNISVIRRKSDYRNKWKISLSFNISQKSSELPILFKQTLKCGIIRFRKDGVCYFEIRNIKDLNTSLRAFFTNFPLISKRQSERCSLLFDAVDLMINKSHLNQSGLIKVLSIKREND